jgi:HEPN domain-containing protein
MPHEDPVTHLTQQWLAKASRDLRAAEWALRADQQLWDIVAFHCQQGAEKALKGFLAWRNIPFRRTPDLVELAEQCQAVDSDFGALLIPASFLREFAVDPRYPGAKREPDEEAATNALELARDVLRFVLARLPAHVHP